QHLTLEFEMGAEFTPVLPAGGVPVVVMAMVVMCGHGAGLPVSYAVRVGRPGPAKRYHQKVVAESRTHMSEPPCESARPHDEAMVRQRTRHSPDRSRRGRRVIASVSLHLRAVGKRSRHAVTVRDYPRIDQRPG